MIVGATTGTFTQNINPLAIGDYVMSNNNIPHSETFTQAPDYLESRLNFFSDLAERAISPSWSKFWLSQVDMIREELKLKMVNPAIKSREADHEHS